jgi:ribosomal protein S12 methylthiotransferase accessory factor
MRRAVEPYADLLSAIPSLVDAHTGIVTQLAEVPRDTSEPPLPLVFRAQLANHRFVGKDDDPESVTSGKGMTKQAAQLSAVGEAIERYGATPWDPGRIRRAAAADLDQPYISPDDLVTYADNQYDQLPYARWDVDTVMDWVEGRRLTDNDRVLVPALGTYLDYPVPHRDEFFFPATSNGLAAGPTLADAILGGLLELIERDAFLLAWFGRRPGTAVDASQSDDPDTVAIARSYARRGVELFLIHPPSDTPASVCIAIGVDHRSGPDRPAAVVGLGADLNPRRARQRAALEVGQIRPALRSRMRDPAVQQRLRVILADPNQVSGLDDHDLLYADPQSLRQLHHWLTAPTIDADRTAPPPDNPVERLALIVDALAEVGVGVCYVNLTPPDLTRLGFSVVRVHGPGLQPIHFGANEARLAGPRLTGLGGAALNTFPHPLA